MTRHRGSVGALLAGLLFILTVSALYEDQAGVNDWIKSNVGEVREVVFHPTKNGVAYVATTQGVIAAINTNGGSLAWKRVLPNDEHVEAFLYHDQGLLTLSGSGKFVSLWSIRDGNKIWSASTYETLDESREHQFDVIQLPDLDEDDVAEVATLSGGHVQARSGRDGHLLWSWQDPISSNTNTLLKLFVTGEDGQRILWVAGRGGANELYHIGLSLHNGKLVKTRQVLAEGENNKYTFTSSGHVLAVKDSNIEYGRLGGAKLKSQALSELVPSATTIDARSNGLFSLSAQNGQAAVFSIEQGNIRKLYSNKNAGSGFLTASTVLDGKQFAANIRADEAGVEVSVFNAETNAVVHTTKLTTYNTAKHGAIKQAYLLRAKAQEFRVLVVGQDLSISLLADKGSWCREEALALISQSLSLDLPAETSVRVELQKEFGHGANDNVVASFLRRIRSEFHQLTHAIAPLVRRFSGASAEAPQKLEQVDALKRDQFGFRKLIIAATSNGKIFALRSVDGEIVWSRYYPGTKPTALYLARGVAHPPPQGYLVLTNAEGTQTTIVTLDLISGEEAEKPTTLPLAVKHTSLLPFVTPTYAHSLALIDTQNKIHIFPELTTNLEALTSNRSSLYFYLVDKENNSVEGLGLPTDLSKSSNTASGIALRVLWTVSFNANNEVIETVAPPQPNEAVGSTTLARGEPPVVLRKYLNRNMLAVATVASGTYNNPSASASRGKAFESSVNVYLVDTVTGAILHHNYHRYSQAPVTLVQSENWVVCHFWNWKNHRYEINVMELFEKKMDWDNSQFSSWAQPELDVLSLTYAFPTGLRTIGVTNTARGITPKQLLLGLSSDRILAMDRRLLNARRPPKELYTAEDKNEGIIPYNAKIPMITTHIITYNHTISNLRGIQTAATDIESTSAVFAYGLDLFYTRVTPANAFDVLNDDFQYGALIVTVSVLIGVTIVSGWVVRHKNLAKRWR